MGYQDQNAEPVVVLHMWQPQPHSKLALCQATRGGHGSFFATLQKAVAPAAAVALSNDDDLNEDFLVTGKEQLTGEEHGGSSKAVQDELTEVIEFLMQM